MPALLADAVAVHACHPAACCAGDSPAAAAEQSQTAEQQLKAEKRAAKALRKQQWEAQQASLAHEGADAGGAAGELHVEAAANGAAEAVQPDAAPQKRKRQAAADVVRQRQCTSVLLLPSHASRSGVE